jgi:hypothetical protein
MSKSTTSPCFKARVQGEGHFSSMTGYSSGCLNTVETWEHVLLYLEYCWRGGSLKYSGWILPWRQTASLSGCFVSWGGSAPFHEQIFSPLLYKYYSVDVYQIIAGKNIARINFKIFDRWGNLIFQSDKNYKMINQSIMLEIRKRISKAYINIISRDIMIINHFYEFYYYVFKKI